MLILTHRHTSDDLYRWNDYEEYDKITSWSKKKEEKSIDLIKNSGCDVAYTSWGKDSVLLLHLIVKSGLKIPIVYVRFDDRDNPDAGLVRDSFLKKYDIDYHEEMYCYKDVRAKDLHWKITEKKYGSKRMTGIRSDESGKRLMIKKIYGYSSPKSHWPITDWLNQEVFSYIFHNDLPLSPVYGYTGGGRWPRAKIRMHSLAGSSADGMGRAEWEKEYYLDNLNKIYKAGVIDKYRGDKIKIKSFC